jgi:hypothetical protein
LGDMYKITLDVWISEDCTVPTVTVQTQKWAWASGVAEARPASLLETQVAEVALTQIREFAEKLQRGEQPSLKAA